MSEHPYGWLSLAPPVAAILLAIATRKVVPALLAGIFAGALLTTGGNPIQAVYDALELHLWNTLVDPGKLRVFSFTLLMGAMIGVINKAGGMQGLIAIVAQWAKSRRSGQLTTWLLGLVIFFDDYANTMLLGNTLRPLCDRLKISREKLAFLVDSTAAPVAGLALVSTWIAVELEYIRDGLSELNAADGWTPIDLFVSSIKYRFYVLLALVFVPLTALLRRDFGPMLRAEHRALRGEPPVAVDQSITEENEPDEDVSARWFNAVLPIVVTVGLVLYLIIDTGRSSILADDPTATPNLREMFGSADSSFALHYGALAGLTVASALAFLQGILSSKQIVRAAGYGAKMVLPALMILLCASTMSRMTSNKSVDGQPDDGTFKFKNHRLYTGIWMQSALIGATDDSSTEASPRFSYKLLPTIVFLLASVVAFCTGTSYGTMGILVPMVIPLAYAMVTASGQTVTPADPILLCCVGGVLAGAVFGDHCSPISDTTVLSSQSSGCDHIAHVRTQMPYAVSVAAVSVLLGTLPLGYGVSIWILFPLQIAALFGILLLFGKVAEDTV